MLLLSGDEVEPPLIAARVRDDDGDDRAVEPPLALAEALEDDSGGGLLSGAVAGCDGIAAPL